MLITRAVCTREGQFEIWHIQVDVGRAFGLIPPYVYQRKVVASGRQWHKQTNLAHSPLPNRLLLHLSAHLASITEGLDVAADGPVGGYSTEFS